MTKSKKISTEGAKASQTGKGAKTSQTGKGAKASQTGKGECAPQTPRGIALRRRDMEIEETIQRELNDMKDSRKRAGDFESSYTEDIGREICVRVAFGQSLRFICSMDHMPSFWCLSKWLYGPISEESEHGQLISAFRLAYGEAQAAQRELLADEMIPIADEAFDRDSAAAAKIKLQAREFKLERLDPKRWAAATRSIEEETVEDFANKMVEALEVIQKRKAQRIGSNNLAIDSSVDVTKDDGSQGDTDK